MGPLGHTCELPSDLRRDALPAIHLEPARERARARVSIRWSRPRNLASAGSTAFRTMHLSSADASQDSWLLAVLCSLAAGLRDWQAVRPYLPLHCDDARMRFRIPAAQALSAPSPHVRSPL